MVDAVQVQQSFSTAALRKCDANQSWQLPGAFIAEVQKSESSSMGFVQLASLAPTALKRDWKRQETKEVRPPPPIIQDLLA